MDHFTHNIIRNELLALTSFPPPKPSDWVFDPRNNCVFANSDSINEHGEPLDDVPPQEWVRRGPEVINAALVVSIGVVDGILVGVFCVFLPIAVRGQKRGECLGANCIFGW